MDTKRTLTKFTLLAAGFLVPASASAQTWDPQGFLALLETPQTPFAFPMSYESVEQVGLGQGLGTRFSFQDVALGPFDLSGLSFDALEAGEGLLTLANFDLPETFEFGGRGADALTLAWQNPQLFLTYDRTSQALLGGGFSVGRSTLTSEGLQLDAELAPLALSVDFNPEENVFTTQIGFGGGALQAGSGFDQGTLEIPSIDVAYVAQDYENGVNPVAAAMGQYQWLLTGGLSSSASWPLAQPNAFTLDAVVSGFSAQPPGDRAAIKVGEFQLSGEGRDQRDPERSFAEVSWNLNGLEISTF